MRDGGKPTKYKGERVWDNADTINGAQHREDEQHNRDNGDDAHLGADTIVVLGRVCAPLRRDDVGADVIEFWESLESCGWRCWRSVGRVGAPRLVEPLRDIGRGAQGEGVCGRTAGGPGGRQRKKGKRPCLAEWRPDSEHREPRGGGVQREGNSNIFARENGKERNLHFCCAGLVLGLSPSQQCNLPPMYKHPLSDVRVLSILRSIVDVESENFKRSTITGTCTLDAFLLMPNMRKVRLRAQLHFSPVKPYKTYQGFTAQKNYLDARGIRYPKKRKESHKSCQARSRLPSRTGDSAQRCVVTMLGIAGAVPSPSSDISLV
ncbi:hypothetical protein B0H13DRAFT_1872307 [Mycena leptocephala]|nr:hypothetical protein B0H13DRAFT_1872307 [Mycena leptocephala]